MKRMRKFKEHVFKVGCYLPFILLLTGFFHLRAEDIEAKLTTSDGSTKFVVQNSGGAEVAGIDSNGNMVLQGSATIKNGNIYGDNTNNLTLWGGTKGFGTDSYLKLDSAASGLNNIEAVLQGAGTKLDIMQEGSWQRIARFYSGGGVTIGNTDTDLGANNLAVIGNIYPGANSSRYVYDDSTNYATRFSSHVYANGDITANRDITANGDITANRLYLNNHNPSIERTGTDGTLELWGASDYGQCSRLSLFSNITGNGSAQLILLANASARFYVQEYWNNNIRFSVWSQGGVSVGGGTTTNPPVDPGPDNLAVAGQIRPGGSAARYITDDSANYATRFSSNVIVNGKFTGIIPTTMTYVGAWQDNGNSAFTDIPNVSAVVNVDVNSYIFAFYSSNGNGGGDSGDFITFRFTDNGTAFGQAGYNTNSKDCIPVSLIGIRAVAAGSHTIKVQWKESDTTNKGGGQFHQLIVFAWSR